MVHEENTDRSAANVILNRRTRIVYLVCARSRWEGYEGQERYNKYVY